MKRPLVFFLLTSFIFGSTEFGQVLRLHSLLQHYSEHLSHSSDLDFFRFLHMHYVGDDENPFDEEQDKQLPFKDHVNQLPEAGTPPDVHHPVDMLYTARSSELLLPDDNKPSSAYRAVILQPPRAV